MKTDTAFKAWDERWRTDDGRLGWLEPDPRVARVAAALSGSGGRVLDLGAGVGRHALLLARLGFDTVAVDMSENGLAEIARTAASAGLDVATRHAPMTDLPFEDASFDYVLSFNVIYHGDGPIVRRAVAEIARVLKPRGRYQGTMLSKRNSNYGIGTEIAPNTFGREGEDDKDHPHFYCDAAELVALFSGFELFELEDHEQKPGHWHWHLVAEKNGRA